MAWWFDSPILRIIAGTVLLVLAASTAGVPEDDRASTRQPGGGRVTVIWSRPPGDTLAVPVAAQAAAPLPGAGRSPSHAFRDPESGRFVEPAPDQFLDAGPQRLRAALSTSSEGLVEEPVAASPGGVRVSLRGRYRSAVAVERSADGTLSVECGAPVAVAVQTSKASPSPAASPGGGAP